MSIDQIPQFDPPRDPKWDRPWWKRAWQRFRDWFPLPPKHWWGE